MSDALSVACPHCHAPAGEMCHEAATGLRMGPHVSRQIVAVTPDGDRGPDLDEDTIPPLGDLEPPPSVLSAVDKYQNLTVLRWEQTYDSDVRYIYVAVKVEPLGWFVSGKETQAIPWDELWNRHLTHAPWVESASRWTTLSLPRSTT